MISGSTPPNPPARQRRRVESALCRNSTSAAADRAEAAEIVQPHLAGLHEHAAVHQALRRRMRRRRTCAGPDPRSTGRRRSGRRVRTRTRCPACCTECAATFVTSSLNDEDDPSAAVVEATLAKNDTRAQRGMEAGAASGAAVPAAAAAGRLGRRLRLGCRRQGRGGGERHERDAQQSMRRGVMGGLLALPRRVARVAGGRVVAVPGRPACSESIFVRGVAASCR